MAARRRNCLLPTLATCSSTRGSGSCSWRSGATLGARRRSARPSGPACLWRGSDGEPPRGCARRPRGWGRGPWRMRPCRDTATGAPPASVAPHGTRCTAAASARRGSLRGAAADTHRDNWGVRIAGPARDDVVDPDDSSSWPDPVRALCREWDERVPPADFISDLEVDDVADGDIRAALQGRRIRAYHATRLLVHEVDGIRRHGLRVFSRELFEDRINAAYAHGHLTGAERDELQSAHMFAVGEDSARGDRAGVWDPTSGHPRSRGLAAYELLGRRRDLLLVR